MLHNQWAKPGERVEPDTFMPPRYRTGGAKPQPANAGGAATMTTKEQVAIFASMVKARKV
jgi:hypothetical protein